MILEEETFEEFGYYSFGLKPQSNKKIIAKCDDCGKVRVLSKSRYAKFCRSCFQKGEKNHNFGRHLSEEHKKKISRSNKGKIITEKQKEEIRKAHLGTKLSEETKQKISNSNRGKKWSAETRQKLSECRKVENLSTETRRKMSESAKKNMSPEKRQKISAFHKERLKNPEENPNWRGGLSFEPYCIRFNNEFKERVREYFNRCCYVCGKNEIDNKAKLCVHHINYNKETCCDDSKPLFVPLCRNCHGKTNFDRNYWQEFFTISLQYLTNGECYVKKQK